MKTDDFIAELVKEAYPLHAQNTHVVSKSIVTLSLSVAISLGLLLYIWGIHPEFMTLAHTGWVEFKFALLTLVSILTLHSVWLMAKPSANLSRIAWQSGSGFVAMLLLTFVPLTSGVLSESAALAQGNAWALAGLNTDTAPAFSWTSVWHTSGAVACLSLPVFIGLMWLMRHMAPTRPALAGACAGFAATVLGMLEFAFNAPYDLSLCFCISYLLCIATLPAIGAWIGHRWLRW